MKIRYFFLTLLLILTAIQGMAQRNGVVLDMETRQPLAGVKVYTNTNKMYTTDKAIIPLPTGLRGASLSRITAT